MTDDEIDAGIKWLDSRRNPSAIYADLHEAYRRKRVLHITEAESRITLPPTMARITLDRPVFDCMPLVKSWEARGTTLDDSLRERGLELAEAKQLVADSCALMWTYLSLDDNGPFWVEEVVTLDPARIMPEGGIGWLAHVFEREQHLQAHTVIHFGPRKDRWTLTRLVLLPTTWARETAPEVWGKGEVDHEHWGEIMARLFACCGALAQAPITVESTSREFTAMNYGRSQGKLPLIAPVRSIVDLGRKVYVSQHPHVDTGREMPFHYRRAGYRTYRHERYVNARGKTTTVGATWVRKDKAPAGEPPAPPIYQVKP